LICGDPRGNFKALFGQIEKIQKKNGPFDALFCVGTFFDPAKADQPELQPYLKGGVEVPIPCFFICGREGPTATSLIDGHPDGVEICKNLTYLGRHGRKEVAGLAVCYLSGVYDGETYHNEDPPSDEGSKYYSAYHESHVEEALIAGYGYKKDKGIDILLTTEWGDRLDSQMLKAERPTATSKSEAVKRLAQELSMKYHFSACEGTYFTLPPYRINEGVCRFYGLASFGNAEKAKALQALNIALPGALMTADQLRSMEELLEAASMNPYSAVVEEEEEEEPEEFPDRVKGEEEMMPNIVQAERQVVLVSDPKHKEQANGDWICGYCGNLNLIARKQTKNCNMRKCAAAHYLNEEGKHYGVMTPAQFMAAEALAKDGPPKQVKRESLYAAQNGGLAANPQQLKKKKLSK